MRGVAKFTASHGRLISKLLANLPEKNKIPPLGEGHFSLGIDGPYYAPLHRHRQSC
jgi:hypothetical protein